MSRSSLLLILVACVGVGALATLVTLMRARRPLPVVAAAPETQAVPQSAPAAAPATPATAAPAPPRPDVGATLARLDAAIAAREWRAAEQAAATLGDPAGLAPADAFQLAQRSDAVRRGQQRDRDGLIEFRNQQGQLDELVPERSPVPTYLGTVAGKQPLALTAEQQRQLLVFTPRGALTTPTAVAELVAELRLLRIEGLMLINECAIDAPLLAGLAGAPLRVLGGTAIAKIPAAAWADLPLLEWLDLGQYAGAAAQPFAALTGHRALKRLVTSSLARVGAEDIRAIATLPALQELTLWGDGLPPADLAPLGRLAALRRLRLHNLQADGQLCTALAGGAPAVEELDFHSVRFDARAIGDLARLAHLRTLRLGNPIPAALLPELARLTAVRTLRCLVSPLLDAKGEPAAALDLTPLATLTELEELELGVATRAVCDIRGLERLAVKRLALQHGGVGDRHLAELRRLPRLEVLRLLSTAVSDDGVAQLAAIARLHDLVLIGNRQLSGSCLATLVAAPGLRSLRLDGSAAAEAGVLACRDPGHLDYFLFRGAQRPSHALVAHVASWPGTARVDLDITGMARADADLLRQGNARRVAAAPAAPTPANGF